MNQKEQKFSTSQLKSIMLNLTVCFPNKPICIFKSFYLCRCTEMKFSNMYFEKYFLIHDWNVNCKTTEFFYNQHCSKATITKEREVGIAVLDDAVGTLHVLYQVLGETGPFLQWLLLAEHTFRVNTAHNVSPVVFPRLYNEALGNICPHNFPHRSVSSLSLPPPPALNAIRTYSFFLVAAHDNGSIRKVESKGMDSKFA